MSVVERIKELCKENKITLAELERNTNIGNGIIARWNKSSPKADSLEKVAEYFGVTTDYLLGRSDFRYPQESIALSSDIPYDELPPEAVKQIYDYIAFIKEQHKKNK